MQLTPKEKADELSEKFYEKINHLNKDSIVTKWKCAIQCALVAVDEILEYSPHSPVQEGVYYELNSDRLSDAIDFWLKVKEELINL